MLGQSRDSFQRSPGEYITVCGFVDQVHGVITAKLAAEIIEGGYSRILLIKKAVNPHIHAGFGDYAIGADQADQGDQDPEPVTVLMYSIGQFGKLTAYV